MTDADLSAHGLARCRRCKRVLTQASLDKGRCRPGNDCAAAVLIRAAYEDGHPDAISFARNVEAALYEEADGSVSMLGMSDPTEEEVGVLHELPADLEGIEIATLHGL